MLQQKSPIIKKIRFEKNATASRFLVDLKAVDQAAEDDLYVGDKFSNQAFFGRYTKAGKLQTNLDAVEDDFLELDKVSQEKNKFESLFIFSLPIALYRNIRRLFTVLKKRREPRPLARSVCIDRAWERQNSLPKIELIPATKTAQKATRFNHLFFKPNRDRKHPVIEMPSAYVPCEPKAALIEMDENYERLGFGWRSLRSALVFGVIMSVFVLPFKGFDLYEYIQSQKGSVLGVSEQAVSNLFVASTKASDLDFAEAQTNFIAAERSFQEIGRKVGNWKILLNILGKILPNKTVQIGASVDNIIRSGELGSKIGESLSQIMLYAGEKEITNQGKIILIEKQISEIRQNTELLNIELRSIDPDSLPAEYADTFRSLREKSLMMEDVIGEIEELAKGLRIFGGFEYDKRYLLVFQNNSEQRASGGFIGSYAILDLSQGEIKKIDIPGGGSYDTEGGMYKAVASPEPLHLVNPRWFFWDANWWPDWPLTAKKLKWFLEESQGPSVDGVISITPVVLEKLLEKTGEVYLEKYDLTINAENFWEVTQTFSEQKAPDHPDYQANPFIDASSTAELVDYAKPKQIIGDLFEAIMGTIKEKSSKELVLDLAKVVADSLEQKQILLQFNDEYLEAKAAEYKGDGRVVDTKYDYLQIVNSNIAGQKTDREIDNLYSLDSEIDTNGTIINTLTIKRVHNGIKRERFTGVRNVNWLRVYVPEGSELLSAEGFIRPDEEFFEQPDPSWLMDPDVAAGEAKAMTHQPTGTKVYDELGKTVFANWSIVDPGESTTIVLKYRLPHKVEAELGSNQKPAMLIWQKQAGDTNSKIELDFTIPDDFRIIESGGELSCLEYGCALDKDKFWYFVIE